MKNLKTLCLAAVLIISSLATSQELTKWHQDKIQKEFVERTKVMDLSEEQQPEVLKLIEKRMTETSKFKDKYEKSSQEMKEAYGVVNRSFYKEMKEVCSQKQMKAWQSYQAEQKKKTN